MNEYKIKKYKEKLTNCADITKRKIYKKKFQFYQNGGATYVANICSETNKITKEMLKTNDEIEFSFIRGSDEIKIKFKVEDHPSGDSNIIYLVHISTYELKIIIYRNEYVAKLNFIRASQEHKFNYLMHVFVCIAKYFDCVKLKLEDDARFTSIDDVQYRALTYRIFENKDSLYFGNEYGFTFGNILPNRSSLYEEEDYNQDKKIVYESKVDDWNDLLNDYYKEVTTRKIEADQVKQIIEMMKLYTGQPMRNIIKKMSDIETSVDIKKIIKKLIDIVTQEHKKKDKPLYGALNRIYKSHQSMTSEKVICKYC